MVCGKKLALTEKYKDDIDSMPKSDALMTGTYYHYLMENWVKGHVETDSVIDTSEIQDPAWAEAVRLFNFVSSNRDRNHWGHVYGTEVRLPVSAEHQNTIAQFFGIFGDDTPTGQIDLLVYMDQEKVFDLEHEHSINLNGPGLYIIDYKTAGARASEESSKALYTQTVQSMTYPLLWNLSEGEQIRGMIFDVIVKHKTLGENSQQVFVAIPDESHGNIVRSAIRIARASKIRARANPYACYYKGFECRFLRNAVCSRT